jgi:hypothetical protein
MNISDIRRHSRYGHKSNIPARGCIEAVIGSADRGIVALDEAVTSLSE